MTDGIQINTEFHYNQQKLLRNHSHKIILLIHENMLDMYQQDMPPIPSLNLSEIYDPVQ